MEEPNPELEQFRQQWRAEVSARSQPEGNKQKPTSTPTPISTPTPAPTKTRKLPSITSLFSRRASKPSKEEEEDVESETIPSLVGVGGDRQFAESSNAKGSLTELGTALDHYEKAVERETQGLLGDSVNLYRKAFRMDHRVDLTYKNKHFPPSSFPSKPANTNPSNASVTVPNTAHHSLDGPPQSVKQLIAGFAGLSIIPAPPAIEGTPAPPCPFVKLPNEILVHIFTDLAIIDVASFARFAQVCKRMAFLVATEESIWKRVCLGNEVGFGAMHYQWQREVLGGPLKEDVHGLEDSDDVEAVLPLSREAITEALYASVYSSSWHQMFRSRPRIRFNGCYISTVNYMRPGQASQSQTTWQSPIHIVTYYRYLRFFRDGTVISLLTTNDPADVVHHLTKELQETHRDGAAAYLPSIVMKNALRGRWHLSNAGARPDVDLKDAEGYVFIETEGVSPRYMYRMKLAVRSSGKGAKNNKLVWQGFWNHNLLTDDSGEFALRNDKAFYFSRVKSYGDGA